MIKMRRKIRPILMYAALFLVMFGVGFAVAKTTETTSAIDQSTLLQFSQNNTLFYYPGGSDNKCVRDAEYYGSVRAEGNTMNEMIWSALTTSGLSQAQAVGVMANIAHEGGVNPVIHEYAFYNSGCWTPADLNGDGLGECTTSSGRHFDNIVLDADGHWDLFQNVASHPNNRPCNDNECQSYGIGLIGFSYGWRVALLQFIQEKDPSLLEYFKHPELYNNLSGDQLIAEIGKENVSKIVALEIEQMMQHPSVTGAVAQMPNGDTVDVARQTAGIWSDKVEQCNTCHEGQSQYNARMQTASDIFGEYYGKSFEGQPNVKLCGVKVGNCFTSLDPSEGGCTEDGMTYYWAAGNSTWSNVALVGDSCRNGNKNGPVATIGTDGCGYSATAMVVTALSGTLFTPLDAYNAAKAQSPTAFVSGCSVSGGGVSQGTDPAVVSTIVNGSNTQLKVEYHGDNSDFNEPYISNALREGKMIIMSVGGEVNEALSYAPHWVAIRAITDSNKWLIFSSSRYPNDQINNTEFDPEVVIQAHVNHRSYWYVVSR